ncbi:MAG TPA: hypothetical protein VKA68_05820 [bacterium]|nr:hypothetical protein [bacterium]
MELSHTITTDRVTIISTAPTVIEPARPYTVRIRITARQSLTLHALTWETPDLLSEGWLESSASFPLDLEPEDTFQASVVFRIPDDSEGFGEIQLQLTGDSSESGAFELDWAHWISVWQPAKPDAREPLNDQLRRRLIQVVNHRPRNGHIFLANWVAFFRDYLNITVPEAAASSIAEEFGLPAEGLPVEPEVYEDIARGKVTFYGIDSLELLAEEDCVESDDRFDADGVREVARQEVDDE